jgi:hypothetical protein
MKVHQRSALRQHSWKPLCPGCSNVIAAEIEVGQRRARRLHSCKTLCPSLANLIPLESEVSLLWNKLATLQDAHDQESNAPSTPLAK